MPVGSLPGEVFVQAQMVAPTSFAKAKQAMAHGGYDHCFVPG